MKVEFNSRVELQRRVLKIVNSSEYKIQLTGLSKPSLDTWVASNNVTEKNIKSSLFRISEQLFFIANKSQDQITEEYQNLQSNITREIFSLKKMI